MVTALRTDFSVRQHIHLDCATNHVNPRDNVPAQNWVLSMLGRERH